MTRIPEPQECEIIKLDHLEGESIISTFEFADLTGEEFIEVLSPQSHYEERCTVSKAKYVPLKERTKTLADLKEGDSTKQLEQAETVLKSEPELKKIRQRLTD